MKKQGNPRTKIARLKRTRKTYEFFVGIPYGSSAMNGYRKAARHFGFRTLEDPCTDGTDTFRLLIHKSSQKLRTVARMLQRAALSDDKCAIWDADMEILVSDIHYFHHNWRHWDQVQDEDALENLSWSRTVTKLGKRYRVTLKTR
jgi:hypothetical protein